MAKFITYTYFGNNLKSYIGSNTSKLEIEAQTKEAAQKRTLLFWFNKLANKGFDCEWEGNFFVCKKDGKKGAVTITRIEKKGDNKNLLFDKSPLSFIDSVVRAFIDQSPKLWQIDIQNKKTKRAAKTFFCFAENGSEANIKAKKALKMLGEGYELANAPHHIATKGDGQAEQYLKSGIKVIDKSPLSFMDSVVRAFRDEK